MILVRRWWNSHLRLFGTAGTLKVLAVLQPQPNSNALVCSSLSPQLASIISEEELKKWPLSHHERNWKYQTCSEEAPLGAEAPSASCQCRNLNSPRPCGCCSKPPSPNSILHPLWSKNPSGSFTCRQLPLSKLSPVVAPQNTSSVYCASPLGVQRVISLNSLKSQKVRNCFSETP